MPSSRPADRRLAVAVTEALEGRRLLAAPELLDLPIANDAPAGRNLYVPLRANDADGDAVELSAELIGDNADDASAELLSTENTFVEMDVEGYGTMTFQFFDDVAPETVRRLTGLAESGYYDGLNIFRVIDDFVIQFGDPTENGQNGSPIRPRVDFSFDDEFDADYLFTGDGQLAMANSGKDTNSSQFFITEGDQRQLDGNFTLFGQLIRGFDVRDAISELTVVESNSRPVDPPRVNTVRVVENDTDAVLRVRPDGDTAGDSFTVRVTATDANGDSESRDYVINSVVESTNSPAILQRTVDDRIDDNRVTAQGEAIVFSAPGEDPDGDELEYVVSFRDLQTSFASYRNATGGTYDQFVEATGGPTSTEDGVGTVSVDDQGDVTFTPEASFTGPATFYVYTRDVVDGTARTFRGNTAFPFDQQEITVAVGESAAIGQARTIRALEGSELEDVVVATFEDGDVAGTAANWTATIDWGDGLVDDGDDGDEDVIVRASDTPGVFEVVGSHTYANTAGSLPVTVTITGDRGAEEIVNSEAVVNEVARLGDDNTLFVNGTSGADTITVEVDGADLIVSVNGESFTSPFNTAYVVEIAGDAGDDSILLDADSPAARILAGAGNDTVVSGNNNDFIDGGDGDDVIDAAGGNDFVAAGAGDDYVMGGTDVDYDDDTLAEGYFDRDTIYGEAGNDTLSGGLDANSLFGGPGDDLLNGSGSRDTLDGGEGNDKLRGYGNADLLIGGDDDDLLLGDAETGPRGGEANAGNDTLEGGNGNDVLRGFWGDDLFRAGSGDDALFGGPGDDTDEDREGGDVVDSIENTVDGEDDSEA